MQIFGTGVLFWVIFNLSFFLPKLALANPGVNPSEVADLNINYNPAIEIISEKDSATGSSSQCRVRALKMSGMDPVLLQKRTVDIEVFEPVNPQKELGSVIIVPPIYGDTLLDTWGAYRFCKAGLQTVLIQQWEYYSDGNTDWGSHDRGTLRAVTAIRHVVEYIVSTKPGPIGILGTSLGALTSSIALSIDSRLTTGVIIVGGGPISEVLANSKIADAVKLKDVRMKEYQLTNNEEYQQKLSENLHYDTVAFAEKSEPKNLWMFIATQDTIVPTSTQWKLWEAWKKPKFTQADLGHIGMMIYSFTFWECSIRDFFVKNLELIH